MDIKVIIKAIKDMGRRQLTAIAIAVLIALTTAGWMKIAHYRHLNALHEAQVHALKKEQAPQ